ncbi:MAG: PAS domain-containing protein [Sediminicola sp.]
MLRETRSHTDNYLIKQLPVATVFVDKDFEVIHASDKFSQCFNLAKNEVLGKPLIALFPNMARRWELAIENSLNGIPSESIRELFLQEGEKKWFDINCLPWYDDHENIVGAILSMEDCTEKVQKEAQLERLRMLLKLKSEISRTGSWEYNQIKEECGWSVMTREILELCPDETPSLQDSINLYKEGPSRNAINDHIQNALTNGTPWSEKLEMVTAHGTDIHVISSGKPIFKDGKIIGLLGTLQDITKHEASGPNPLENEQLLSTLIDNLPLNIFVKDLDSRKTLVNRSECEYVGVKDPSELIGKSDFDLYERKTAQMSRDEDLLVINSLSPILGKETLHVKKDGKQTTFLTSKIPLLGPNGKAKGIIGFSLDISESKQKEAEMRDLINVTSLQNKKLINFAHIISHNLRSHTANFSMLLDFLVQENDEMEKKKIIGMLTSASDNLLETLDNLNEVVAISTNVGLEKHPVHLNSKIRAVQENLMAFLLHNNATIINMVPDEVYVKAIPAYLESILMNFITNSIKYKDPSRDPVIKISTQSHNDHIILSIADNGLGLDLKKYGSKLFGMYKTFHNNSDARGMGLYITKNQIEAMDGKIITCSEVGKGTTFNIYFNEKN